MEKKEWSEPELIVLVRSKPEEAVLTACKLLMLRVTSDYNYGGCDRYSTGPSPYCTDCEVGDTS